MNAGLEQLKVISRGSEFQSLEVIGIKELALVRFLSNLTGKDESHI